MVYEVVVPKRIQKRLNRIDRRYHDRIYAAIMSLSHNPYIGKKLKGDHKDDWSFRVWPYRIVYRIFKKKLVILIINIGHRGGGVY